MKNARNYPARSFVFDKITFQPFTLVATWLLVIVENNETPIPNGIYLFTSFPRTEAYCLFGYAGIIIFSFSVALYKKRSPQYAYPMLNLIGSICIFLSITALLLFSPYIHYLPGYSYTFPVVTMILFAAHLVYFNYYYIVILS